MTGIKIDIPKEAPGLERHTTGRSRSDIRPEITVHFTNGIKVKEWFLKNYRSDFSACNYVGNLEDSTSNVAVTGCLEKSDDEIDMRSWCRNTPKTSYVFCYLSWKIKCNRESLQNGSLNKISLATNITNKNAKGVFAFRNSNIFTIVKTRWSDKPYFPS